MKHVTLLLYLILSTTTAHGMCGPERPNVPFTYLFSVLNVFAQNSSAEREKAGDFLPNIIEASQLVPAYPIKPLAECTTPEECFCMYYPETQYWQNLIQYIEAHKDTIIKYDEAMSMMMKPYSAQIEFAELVTVLTRDQQMPCHGIQTLFLRLMRFHTQANIEKDYPELQDQSTLTIACSTIQNLRRQAVLLPEYRTTAMKAFGETITSQLIREQERIVHTLTVAQDLVGTLMLQRSFSETQALLNTLANANASASSTP